MRQRTVQCDWTHKFEIIQHRDSISFPLPDMRKVCSMPPERIIDLRSDTVTKPTPEMREAMAEAEVGDDVYGEDPSVNELEAEAAAALGKETAVFFPTGTQSNLCAILSHCQRGDEMLVGETYHAFVSEAGGASALGGVAFSTLPVRKDGGLAADDVAAAVRADDPHSARTSLLCLENTTFGRAIPLASLRPTVDAARDNNLRVHLDGARLFNASIALDEDAGTIAALADTVSVCLSKGLGAPAGTILAADKKLEPLIRRNRKILGGGMRQAGIFAAAGRHALKHNVARLAEDHRRAADLAGELSMLPAGSGLKISFATNMVHIEPLAEDHAELHAHLAECGILIGSKRPAMRIVTHLGISDSDIAAAVQAFFEFYDRSYAVHKAREYRSESHRF